ncbi:MAG: hypothetical protein LBJ68_00590 [Endomicrobium sp.]|jgi:hypothetical protein|nr:hypothetical protein [Endomicrobium sp.]
MLFYSSVPFYDLIAGTSIKNFSIIWPKIRFFIEPFYFFSFYILTLNKNFYKFVITSWTLWIICCVFVYSLIVKRNFWQILNNMFYLLMIFITILSFSILFPVPGPKLKKPKDYVSVDVHSHTIHSHDNIASVKTSLKAHSWAGFDTFFNTEHNNTNGFSMFPKKLLYKMVYPGIQIQTKDNVSVIILSSKKFNEKSYKNMKLIDIIKKAHKNKMLVIMPHWWKWHKHTLNELKNIGIDGFEIYNCGYRNFEKDECYTMMNFAKKNNLLMFGVTDWHGWGCMTDVWTVFKGDISKNIQEQLVKRPETKVILYRNKQSSSIFRFIFEPFYVLYYYVSSTNIVYVISFIIWIMLIFIIFKSKFFSYGKKYLPFIMIIICMLSIIYFYTIAKQANTNEIVIKQLIPILSIFCLLWIILSRIINKE